MNDVIDRALHTLRMPTRLEPTGLSLDRNLRPDGISIPSWDRGKPLAWDVTCAHPLAASWSSTSLRRSSAVATTVEESKTKKYKDLETDFSFQPVSMETFGGMGQSTARFIEKLGDRIAAVTGEKRSIVYLRQRLAVAVQVGNSACILETLPAPGAVLPADD